MEYFNVNFEYLLLKNLCDASDENIGKIMRALNNEIINKENVLKLFDNLEDNRIYYSSRVVLIQDNLKLFDTCVYVAILSNKSEKFIKIGMSSCLDYRQSFFKEAGYDVHNFFMYVFNDKESANKYEKEIHSRFHNNRYTPLSNFSGMTECFKYNILYPLMIEHGIA